MRITKLAASGLRARTMAPLSGPARALPISNETVAPTAPPERGANGC